MEKGGGTISVLVIKNIENIGNDFILTLITCHFTTLC